jgi:hypothetical protein
MAPGLAGRGVAPAASRTMRKHCAPLHAPGGAPRVEATVPKPAWPARPQISGPRAAHLLAEKPPQLCRATLMTPVALPPRPAPPPQQPQHLWPAKAHRPACEPRCAVVRAQQGGATRATTGDEPPAAAPYLTAGSRSTLRHGPSLPTRLPLPRTAIAPMSRSPPR